MAIRTVVTRGYGNGTFNGTISLVVLHGYIAGAAVTPGVNARGMSFVRFSDRRGGVEFSDRRSFVPFKDKRSGV